MKVRDLELVLTANGRAELVDCDSGEVVWAADSDEEFQEEFPEFLDENDAESVFNYLLEADVITQDEEEIAGLSVESLTAEQLNDANGAPDTGGRMDDDD